VSIQTDATLGGSADDFSVDPGQDGVLAAIRKFLHAPASAEKDLLIRELAQTLKKAAPEATTGEGGLARGERKLSEAAPSQSPNLWYLGAFVTIFIGVFAIFQNSTTSHMGRLEAGIASSMSRLDARIGGVEARIGGVEARMDKFYDAVANLQVDFAIMQVSQVKMQASLTEMQASLTEMQASQAEMQASQAEMQTSINRLLALTEERQLPPPSR
jgi:hypothetical protein